MGDRRLLPPDQLEVSPRALRHHSAVVFLFALIGLILPEVNGPLPVALEGAISATALTRVIFPVHLDASDLLHAAFTVTFLSG